MHKKPQGYDAVIEEMHQAEFKARKPDTKDRPEHEIQKRSWTEVAKFDNYDDALRMKLSLSEPDKPMKIRRRRNHFSLMQGKPVKKTKSEPLL